MKKIILNCNDCFAAYKFRLGLIKKLQQNYDVTVVASFDHYTQMLRDENVKVVLVDSESTGTSIFQDIKLLLSYQKIFKIIKPDILINYTIKPHTYGAMAASKKTKVINVVSGVGSVFQKRNFIYRIVKTLYKVSSNKVDHYVFLNNDDYLLFNELHLIKKRYSFIDSEGIDLSKFEPYIDLNKKTTFLFAGRLVKEKGILEYLEAAKIIKKRFPQVRFLVAGSFYKKKSAITRETLNFYVNEGIIEYLGHCYDMNLLLHDVHVIVLPSYREGMPISLIEGLATKKFLIASNVTGCRDIISDGYNGYLVSAGSSYDLAFKMEKYINASNKETLHNQAYLSSKRFDQTKIISKMMVIVEG